jgi:hypothetical protein
MWMKSWYECRFRVLLAALIGGLYSVNGFWMKGGFGWDTYCQLMGAVVIPVVALLMAGSGVNSQTSWGMTQGFHPSMYFLLSLPISRRRAMAIRTFMGAGFTLLFILLTVGGIGLVVRWRGSDVPLSTIGASMAFMTVAAFAFFGLETFLTTILDEIWAGVLGFGLAGALFGGAWALRDITKKPGTLELISGGTWAKHGELGLPMMAVFLTIGIGSLAAALYVVERKEY